MNNKKIILILSLIILAATILSVSVFAYANGSVVIRDANGNRLGVGDVWNNNKSKYASGKILYGSVEADATPASLQIKIGYTYLDESLNEVTKYTGSRSSDGSLVLSETLTIPDGTLPANARGYFWVGTNSKTMCKAYNYGFGVSECTHGATCPWNR